MHHLSKLEQDVSLTDTEKSSKSKMYQTEGLQVTKEST